MWYIHTNHTSTRLSFTRCVVSFGCTISGDYARQTGARVMVRNRRENIDYVALHADRRPRRAMSEGFNREGRQVAGSVATESPCRKRASTNPYRRLAFNPSKGTYVGHRLVGTGDNSPQQKVCVGGCLQQDMTRCR